MSLKNSKTSIQRKLENSGKSQWIKQEGGQSFDARLAKLYLERCGLVVRASDY
jgi:hypothetical protein